MKSKRLATLVAALMGAIAMLATLGSAAQAATPNPGYGQFAGCPSKAENSEISTCLVTKITGGHFKMGSKDVPIENPMTLSGGTNPSLGNFSFNSKGGLPPVKQKVPGGVIGLTGLTWLAEFLGIEALTLYAVTELAGTPNVSNPEAVKLPIKVHLINGVLGNSCYVGSNSNPINLTLITGTTNPPPPNQPISGKGGTPSFDFEKEILTSKNGTFVDNSFSAPGANGCVLTLFGFIPISINGLVNSQSGLPAAAGTNETVQEFDLEIAPVTRVYP